jgi:RimJ/RimL family protein N-acetyltransferase
VSGVVLEGKLCRLRPYRLDDAAALCAVADNPNVARWMTRAFPSPYTLLDAQEWLAHATSGGPAHHYAVEAGGVLAGGIGYELRAGERGANAVFGYWLGEPYWGRGIGTDAARTLAGHALASGSVCRLEATVFVANTASARVLEKCGFALEGLLRAYYLDRAGNQCDALMFARLAAAP